MRMLPPQFLFTNVHPRHPHRDKLAPLPLFPSRIPLCTFKCLPSSSFTTTASSQPCPTKTFVDRFQSTSGSLTASREVLRPCVHLLHFRFNRWLLQRLAIPPLPSQYDPFEMKRIRSAFSLSTSTLQLVPSVIGFLSFSAVSGADSRHLVHLGHAISRFVLQCNYSEPLATGTHSSDSIDQLSHAGVMRDSSWLYSSLDLRGLQLKVGVLVFHLFRM